MSRCYVSRPYVLREWNRAQVYQKTIALFAQRLGQER
jgi:membrane-bound lytic murein transglycosylase B